MSHSPGVAAPGRTDDRARVLRLSETHFLTDEGPLCGKSAPYCWTIRESETTCGYCRALLESSARCPRPGPVPHRATIGRLRQHK